MNIIFIFMRLLVQGKQHQKYNTAKKKWAYNTTLDGEKKHISGC